MGGGGGGDGNEHTDINILLGVVFMDEDQKKGKKKKLSELVRGDTARLTHSAKASHTHQSSLCGP